MIKNRNQGWGFSWSAKLKIGDGNAQNNDLSSAERSPAGDVLTLLQSWMEETWRMQRQMDEQTEEDENSPEVLDGVISESSDVILSISHQALLLISMEELRWNWIHLALYLSLSFSRSLWAGKAMIRVIIIYYERIPSQAKHLILQ